MPVSPPSNDSRDRLLLAVVVLCFFPYAAVPLGSNTNLPIASLLAGAWVALNMKRCSASFHPAILLLLFGPMLSAIAYFLVGAGDVAAMVKGATVFVLWGLPAAVGFVALSTNGTPAVQTGIRIGIVASSALALAQYVAILSGRLPFLGLYRAPGYPEIEPLAESIILYSKRPFGWFPEPSFMAGTLVLACGVLLVLRIVAGRNRWDHVALLTATAALVCSRSGVLIVGLVLLLPLVVRRIQPRHFVMALGLTAGAVWLAARTLSARTRMGDWSWGDRYASVGAAVRFWFADPFALVVGLGRDSIGVLYADHEISLTGFEFEYYPRGIYSVLGRYALEGGIVFGFLPIILIGSLMSVTCMRVLGVFRGGCFCVLWFAVASAVATYDTASVIWLAVGVGLAVGDWNSHADRAAAERPGDRRGADARGAALQGKPRG